MPCQPCTAGITSHWIFIQTSWWAKSVFTAFSLYPSLLLSDTTIASLVWQWPLFFYFTPHKSLAILLGPVLRISSMNLPECSSSGFMPYSLIICSLFYIYRPTLVLLGTILSSFPHAPYLYQWFQATSPISLWHQFNFMSLIRFLSAENISFKLVANLWYSDT